MSSRKVQAIAQMQRPQSKDDLICRFLGLVAYVAKFLEKKSQNNSPVTGVIERRRALMLECGSGRGVSAD